MSFASIVFFIFLPIVFSLHWLLPRRKWQNTVLLLASYVFYGWWDWRFCFLMLASSLIDYWAGLWIYRETDARRRKRILACALTANLLILGFFKYANFFVDSAVTALAVTGLDLPTWSWKIVLPVGISFYTFQSMSYSLDVYYRRFQPFESVLDYSTFVSFFPQLVAGPIERATALLPQFRVLRTFDGESAAEGCRLIIWGLAKKMLIADNLAPIANAVYSSPNSATGAQLLLGTICFAFQIYCDFSGYSDIAIGTARLFGIRLMRNFAYPYFSQTITEFWRRWHISLSTWFRDYLYIPLGGNRVPPAKHYRNLLVVAVVSGLWHGAAWHFIVWGALHGAYLVAERLWSDRRDRGAFSRPGGAIPGGESLVPNVQTLLRILRTFALTCLAWVFFRSETVPEALHAILKIIDGVVRPSFYFQLASLCRESAFPLSLLAVFLLWEWIGRRGWNPFNVAKQPWVVRWTAYTALFWAIILFGTGKSEEFIYFQF
jgi:alginate O-acetyltransferase complex protein AlgI